MVVVYEKTSDDIAQEDVWRNLTSLNTVSETFSNEYISDYTVFVFFVIESVSFKHSDIG